LCVNKSQFVPVIFEPPCIRKLRARSFKGGGDLTAKRKTQKEKHDNRGNIVKYTKKENTIYTSIYFYTE
jgi:hypothetical protein